MAQRRQTNITTIKGKIPTYRIRWRDTEGKRHSANYATEADARRELREKETTVEDIRNGRVKHAITSPLLKDFAADFMATVAKVKNKPSEYVSKEKSLRLNILPALGERQLHTIGTKDVDSLAASLLAEGYSKKTANNVLTHLRRILSYAKRVEAITSIPHFEQFKVTKKKIEFLSSADLSALLLAAEKEPAVRAMILLGADAGLRAGEIRALHWEDVDLSKAALTVRLNEYRGELGSPKSGRDRVIPLTTRLSAALLAIRQEDSALVFRDSQGGLLTEKAETMRLRRQVKRAGLKGKIGWHLLRHGFCSYLMMRGANIRVIQELAGHATITTTMAYLHLAPSSTRDAIDLLEPGTKSGPEQSK